MTLILALLLALPAFAQVEAILSSREIAVPLQNGGCEIGAVLALFPQEGDNEPLGFAEIEGFAPPDNRWCKASVSTHSRSALIRVGDRAVLLDLRERNQNLKGRYDLLDDRRKDVAVRYKPLVYTSYLFGQTAATLNKGEFLVGISPLMYGVTDRLQLNTTPFLLWKKVGELGVKYQFFRDEDIRLSFLATGLRFFEIGKGSGWMELQYDSTSNGRSMSHTKLRYTFKLPDSVPLEDINKERQGSLELTSVHEWVLPSWHRILLGPKVTAGDERDLGLLFAVLFLYRHFHWSVNLEINTFRELNFRENKQALWLDMFWRF